MDVRDGEFPHPIFYMEVVIMKNVRVDTEVLEAIDMRLPKDLNEAEIRWWLSVLPESKRYIMRKIKKANRRINDIETYLELLEEKYNRKFNFKPNSQTVGMNSTEKKNFAKNKLIMSVEYHTLAKELNKLSELVEGYNIDLENLNEKSLSVRKLSNFELTNLMYEYTQE